MVKAIEYVKIYHTPLQGFFIQACFLDNELSNFACPGQVLVYLIF